MARQVYSTIRESCFALFRDIVGDLGIDDRVAFNLSPMQMNFDNGSRIIFRGMDKAEKLKSIHNVSLIWIEEAAELSYAGFKELLGRLRHPSLKMYVILSLNPTSKSNWAFKHFFELPKFDDEELYSKRIVLREGVYYHHSVCRDNHFLPESYFQRLEEIKSYDPDLWRIAWLGKFGINGTRVLPQFEIMPHDKVKSEVNKIPRKFKFAGLDFGFVTSYNACIRCAVDDVNKFLYIYWEWYERGLTDDQIVERLAEFKKTREVIVSDSAEPKTIAYLRKNGIIATGCKKFAGSRLYNIKKIKRFKKIICSDACKNCIAELSDLTFDKDKDGNLIEDAFNIDSHCFDSLVYSLDGYDIGNLKISFPRSELGI